MPLITPCDQLELDCSREKWTINRKQWCLDHLENDKVHSRSCLFMMCSTATGPVYGSYRVNIIRQWCEKGFPLSSAEFHQLLTLFTLDTARIEVVKAWTEHKQCDIQPDIFLKSVISLFSNIKSKAEALMILIKRVRANAARSLSICECIQLLVEMKDASPDVILSFVDFICVNNILGKKFCVADWLDDLTEAVSRRAFVPVMKMFCNYTQSNRYEQLAGNLSHCSFSSSLSSSSSSSSSNSPATTITTTTTMVEKKSKQTTTHSLSNSSVTSNVGIRSARVSSSFDESKEEATTKTSFNPPSLVPHCVICLTDSNNRHVILPCAHECVCESCSPAILKNRVCPVCNGIIQDIIKIYRC